MVPCLRHPMVLSGFTAGQGGMRMTRWEGSEVKGSGLGSGTGIQLHIRRQERGLVTHCGQITALNHNLHLPDKSLSIAACTSKEQEAWTWIHIRLLTLRWRLSIKPKLCSHQ